MHNIEQILGKKVIQGGMGIGVSGPALALAVSCSESKLGLGVVSATAPDLMLLRGLQQGDISGEIREALVHFPNQDIAERIIANFYIEGGKDPCARYRLNRFPTFEKTGDTEFILTNKDLEDCLVAGAFVEVYLAKKGHNNPVGANFLNKIGWAQLPTLYGAMLAEVDVVLIGAGFPKDIPEILTAFESGSEGKMSIPVGNNKYRMVFDPQRFNTTELMRPIFLGIVGNHLGVRGLPNADGYIFEGPIAGGHNPPARSKALNSIGEPNYGPEDDINFPLLNVQLKKNGGHQPFWEAGNYAGRLKEALSHGASGVQVGTPFAFCEESRIIPELKYQSLMAIMGGLMGGLVVYTSARASPTGFPFKELPVPGTIACPEIYEARNLHRVCDMGCLIDIIEAANGRLITRCPAGPVEAYVQKGGNIEDTFDRQCLCNGLAATIGLGMPGEKPIITSGADLSAVKALVAKHGMNYSAQNVIDYILARG